MSAEGRPQPDRAGLCVVSAGEEQRWNQAALATAAVRRAWRLWAYRESAVVLGRAQYDLLAQLGNRSGPALLARAAGGGAVLTGPWMFGLSILLPVRDPLLADGIVPSYRWLGQTLALALRRCGVDAQALTPDALRGHAGAGRAAAAHWACFGSLSPWEVVVGGRKIAGLAQVRQRNGALLVAGVLLRPPPWQMLCERLGRPAADAEHLADATTSLADATGAGAARRTPEALAMALAEGFQAALSLTDPSDRGR